MKLTEFVVREAILPELQVSSKEDAVKQMVSALREAGRISVEHFDDITAAIMKREELGSTGIGRGVAVPHTKHACVDELICAVALCQAGLDFSSLDGEPVYILFLLVSPPDRPGDHLRGLETITRHLKDDDFCRFLRQSNSQEQVWDLLAEADDGRTGQV